MLIDDVGRYIYIWENTLTATTTEAYEGEETMSFTSNNGVLVGLWCY
ncbi:hypothetical protein [Marinilabilia rubra]|nr:hypothetical protein [Marinilabilia rubra]